MKLIIYINILLKHNLRNRTKEIPVGLRYLGKTGLFLTKPLVETIILLLWFLFINISYLGYCVENNYLSPDFGIAPGGLVISIIFQFLLYEYYYKNYRSIFNLLFLKATPLTNFKRFIYLLLYEIVSLKLLIVFSIFVSLLLFSIYRINILLNLFILITNVYLVLCSLNLIIKIFIKQVTKWISYSFLIIISLFFLTKIESSTTYLSTYNNTWFYLLFITSMMIVVLIISYILFKNCYYRKL